MRFAHPITAHVEEVGGGFVAGSVLTGPILYVWRGLYGPAVVWALLELLTFLAFRRQPGIMFIAMLIVHVVLVALAFGAMRRSYLERGWWPQL